MYEYEHIVYNRVNKYLAEARQEELVKLAKAKDSNRLQGNGLRRIIGVRLIWLGRKLSGYTI